MYSLFVKISKIKNSGAKLKKLNYTNLVYTSAKAAHVLW
jgi:hypothetical protein